MDKAQLLLSDNSLHLVNNPQQGVVCLEDSSQHKHKEVHSLDQNQQEQEDYLEELSVEPNHQAGLDNNLPAHLYLVLQSKYLQ